MVRGIMVAHLTPPLSPSHVERVPDRTGEGRLVDSRSFLGSGVMKLKPGANTCITLNFH
jgi:hypothetical protein